MCTHHRLTVCNSGTHTGEREALYKSLLTVPRALEALGFLVLPRAILALF